MTKPNQKVINYFICRKELKKELAKLDKQLKNLKNQRDKLEDKVILANKVTEVYRGYPLAVHSWGISLVDQTADYIAAQPYQSAGNSSRFKKGSWIIKVQYRPSGLNMREKVFFIGLPPKEKKKAYTLAKDVVVALAGGKSTKLGAQWAEAVKNSY